MFIKSSTNRKIVKQWNIEDIGTIQFIYVFDFDMQESNSLLSEQLSFFTIKKGIYFKNEFFSSDYLFEIMMANWNLNLNSAVTYNSIVSTIKILLNTKSKISQKEEILIF